MAIVGIMLWWYTDGWKQAARNVRARLVSLYDYFSIDILLKTLFSPFRQISAGRIDGPIAVQIRAFGDRLLSRIIGFVVRSVVMVIGTLAIAAAVVVGGLYLLAWLFVPAIPIGGIIMTMIGWIPWQI